MLILPVLLYTLLRAGASPIQKFRAAIRSPSGCPFPTSVPTSESFSTKVVYHSPDGLFSENIAVRSSSQLLLTSVISPSLHMLDPTAPNGTLTSVFTFRNSTSLTGIAELNKDVFAIAASVTDNTTRSTVPGSVAIWRVDFTGGVPGAPSVTPLAVLTQALSANGLSALLGHPDVVLAADSVAGAVWQVNARTGASRLALQDPSMDADAPPPTLGINALHHLSLSSVPLAVDAQSGNVSAAGAVETLASFGRRAAPDDFALDDAGPFSDLNKLDGFTSKRHNPCHYQSSSAGL
ncbi:hypothetical protein GGX14DRAFT_545340 [Mycena pura]|uniref:Uncharacterized protein n=1 Tax=Mycena pura TaxID=153505 RepID=A0AAD6Y7L1_9AGAR|nr:hypothetical protein GGX14DRAFT_545340 [Mycena pura]